MKKMVTDIEAKIKDVDKISALETKLADMEKKVSDTAHKSPSSLSNLFGGFGAGGTKGSAPKNAPRNIGELMKHINELKDGVDTRMLNMEKRVDAIRHKIGGKNLERLEELISSKQDISENIVPRRVREEVEKILSTFSFEVEDMADAAKNLADNVEKSNDEFEDSFDTVKDLQTRLAGFEKVLNDLQSGFSQTSQTMNKLAEEVEHHDISEKEVEDVIKEADKLTEKVEDVEKSLTTMERDNHMKDMLKSELSKLASPPTPPKPKHRRHAAAPGKPAKKGRAGKPGKRPAKKVHEKKPQRKRGGSGSGSGKKAGMARAERIALTMRRVEMAYENDLISKERYDRITEKLRRLKRFR